jgi:hypothetical protein
VWVDADGLPTPGTAPDCRKQAHDHTNVCSVSPAAHAGSFAGFRPQKEIKGIFGDPHARITSATPRRSEF